MPTENTRPAKYYFCHASGSVLLLRRPETIFKSLLCLVACRVQDPVLEYIQYVGTYWSSDLCLVGGGLLPLDIMFRLLRKPVLSTWHLIDMNMYAISKSVMCSGYCQGFVTTFRPKEAFGHARPDVAGGTTHGVRHRCVIIIICSAGRRGDYDGRCERRWRR